MRGSLLSGLPILQCVCHRPSGVMEEDEEAMLELELVSGVGSTDDGDDDSLLMALGEEDSFFGSSEQAEGEEAEPLPRVTIKKARLVRKGSLAEDFLSQEPEEEQAAAPAREPHSQPITESSNGTDTFKDAVDVQPKDVPPDADGIEAGNASALVSGAGPDSTSRGEGAFEDGNESGEELSLMGGDKEGDQNGDSDFGESDFGDAGDGGGDGIDDDNDDFIADDDDDQEGGGSDDDVRCSELEVATELKADCDKSYVDSA